MNVHPIPPKVLVARHNQLLRFESNGQPLERSQVAQTGGTPAPPTHPENKGLTAPLCVSSSKQSYLQAKPHKQKAYRRCLRRFGFRNGDLSKSQVPTCRGPGAVETLISNPQFVCKHRGSGMQEKSEMKETKVTKVG